MIEKMKDVIETANCYAMELCDGWKPKIKLR